MVGLLQFVKRSVFNKLSTCTFVCMMVLSHFTFIYLHHFLWWIAKDFSVFRADHRVQTFVYLCLSESQSWVPNCGYYMSPNKTSVHVTTLFPRIVNV
jgi:hypothetical protein